MIVRTMDLDRVERVPHQTAKQQHGDGEKGEEGHDLVTGPALLQDLVHVLPRVLSWLLSHAR